LIRKSRLKEVGRVGDFIENVKEWGIPIIGGIIGSFIGMGLAKLLGIL